ncbi:MAG: amino acid ABC transporter substrate-binding protein [Clostridiales bacterium]|nr:amino acid ABC transporter substrate-binding protein [Clostridiales bacterium]
MRKILSLTLALALLTLTAFGCAAKPKNTQNADQKTPAQTQTPAQNSDNSLQYIKDNGKFVVGLDETFIPMGFRDEKTNEIVGFDVDLAKEVGKRMGVEVVFQPIDWDAKEQELSTKNIDCIWNGFSISDERKQKMTLTEAYMNNQIALVVKKDSTIKTLADMSGKKAGVQSGSSGAQAIDDNANFKKSLKDTVEYKDYLTALMDLDKGSTDAVVMDSTMARYLITKEGKNFRVVDEALLPEQYAVGLRKGEEALKAEIGKQLKAMAADGTMATISKKWFGEDVTIIK